MNATNYKLFLALCILMLTFSCSKKQRKEQKEEKGLKIMDKIAQLPEFKETEKRIDSLKQVGIEVELTIGLVKDSFYPEDSLKNLSIVFIEEDYGFVRNTLYHVKFNKLTEEIVSIESLEPPSLR